MVLKFSLRWHSGAFLNVNASQTWEFSSSPNRPNSSRRKTIIVLYSHIFIFVYIIVCVCFAHVYLCTICLPGIQKVRSGQHNPWPWSYRHLWASTQELGIKPRSSARTNVLNSWAISPHPYFFFWQRCHLEWVWLIVKIKNSFKRWSFAKVRCTFGASVTKLEFCTQNDQVFEYSAEPTSKPSMHLASTAERRLCLRQTCRGGSDVPWKVMLVF